MRIKLRDQGRITIPKAIREGLQWKAGINLAFEIRGESVRVFPTTQANKVEDGAQDRDADCARKIKKETP